MSAPTAPPSRGRRRSPARPRRPGGADDPKGAQVSPKIVLLDPEGRILAANEAWRSAMAQRLMPPDVGEPGGVYAEAVASLYRAVDASWLAGQIAELAAGRTGEVRLTAAMTRGDAPGPRQVCINRLEHEGRTMLVATHSDLSDVADAEDQLHTLEDQLAVVRSDERRRFAQSLAEVAAAHLDALRRDLAELRHFVDSEDAHGMLARMEGSLGEALRETRDFTHLLHPSALDDGLVAAARQLLRDVAQDGEIRVRFRVSGQVDLAPRPVQHAALRLLQEALSNIQRHSGAQFVRVTLSARGGALRIRVADDGRGLRAGAALGLGIIGMRERAAELGGDVEVIGGRKGATVVARLPYGGGASS